MLIGSTLITTKFFFSSVGKKDREERIYIYIYNKEKKEWFLRQAVATARRKCSGFLVAIIALFQTGDITPKWTVPIDPTSLPFVKSHTNRQFFHDFPLQCKFYFCFAAFLLKDQRREIEEYGEVERFLPLCGYKLFDLFQFLPLFVPFFLWKLSLSFQWWLQS